MHSLKISNKCLTRWGSCMMSTSTSLSALNAQRGSSLCRQLQRDEDGHRMSHYQDHLRAHETNFEKEVLWQKDHHNFGALGDLARSVTTLSSLGSPLRRPEPRFHLNVSKPNHLVAGVCTS